MPGLIEDLLGVLGVAFASALVPLINIEAYLGVRGSVSAVDNVWLLGFAAGFGQMVGKVVWYYLGASSLHWRWVRKRIETPKAEARLEKWRTRTHERPVLTGALVFLSAISGFPPFAPSRLYFSSICITCFRSGTSRNTVRPSGRSFADFTATSSRPSLSGSATDQSFDPYASA